MPRAHAIASVSDWPHQRLVGCTLGRGTVSWRMSMSVGMEVLVGGDDYTRLLLWFNLDFVNIRTNIYMGIEAKCDKVNKRHTFMPWC